MSAEPAESTKVERRGGRSGTVLLVALAELLLAVLIVAVALGDRLPSVASLVAQVPGGRLAAAGGAAVLLVVAAIAMTVLVSD